MNSRVDPVVAANWFKRFRELGPQLEKELLVLKLLAAFSSCGHRPALREVVESCYHGFAIHAPRGTFDDALRRLGDHGWTILAGPWIGIAPAKIHYVEREVTGEWFTTGIPTFMREFFQWVVSNHSLFASEVSRSAMAGVLGVIGEHCFNGGEDELGAQGRIQQARLQPHLYLVANIEDLTALRNRRRQPERLLADIQELVNVCAPEHLHQLVLAVLDIIDTSLLPSDVECRLGEYLFSDNSPLSQEVTRAALKQFQVNNPTFTLNGPPRQIDYH